MFEKNELKKQTKSFSPFNKKRIPVDKSNRSNHFSILSDSSYFLQRYLGNRYMQSSGNVPIIQKKCDCGGTCTSCSEEEEIMGMQAKLKIGEPDDVYEREADRVAERVMRMPNWSLESEDERPNLGIKLQRMSSAENGFPESTTDIRLNQSGGHSLSESTLEFMEPRFGIDFGDVRLHSDSDAHQTASRINARAFTYGSHIWMGQGESEQNRKLMAHELTHVIQQNSRDRNSKIVRRHPPPVAAAPPQYRDCSDTITGVPNPNELLENGRQRAREFVGSATRALAAAPVAGTTYATALNRHFISPNAAQRATISANYDQIMQTLVVSNFICNSNNICGGEQAFWIPQDDLIHVCRPFWALDRTCRAIVLIHEGAHDVGVDAAVAGHPPNRGSAAYPAGNVPPPAGQTTAGRMINPDAYAFFAAHIWRNTDTGRTCF